MSTYALNAIVAPDAYTAAPYTSPAAPGKTFPSATLQGANFKRVRLDVSNQAIYYQLQLDLGGGSGAWEDTEVFMYQGSLTIPLPAEGCTGIRVRAAVPFAQLPATATAAVVTVSAQAS